ncbi:OB-fold domain-containing protein [Xanthobacter sp. DSM 24535]|uniref:Zn-ribbon domain-containing OB-fold protein n=1 Tax=Roseixanthobacter psychrophilus TaxID=3119917 RepID=UPI00372AF0BB
MSPSKLPDPVVNPETVEYWTAAKEGRLIVRHCRSCDRPHHYPRAICPFCQSDDLDWQVTAGTGTLYSFSHMKAASEPYVMAFVTMDEGPTMMTNIVDTDPDTLAIGDRVEVVFAPSAGEWRYPMFRKVT